MAIEVARGGLWLGRTKTIQATVLYIDEESADVLLRNRLKKLLAGKGLSSEKLDLHFAVQQGLIFNDPPSVRRLRVLLDKVRPKFIIVDSLIRAHRGQENSATEMAVVFDAVKRIVHKYHCFIVFADHQKKVGQFVPSADQLLRGSSEKAAFVDTLLSIQTKKDAIFVEHSKSRWGKAVQAFAVAIQDNEDETAITVKYLGRAEEIREAAKQKPVLDFLQGALTTKWQSRSDLMKRAAAAQ